VEPVVRGVPGAVLLDLDDLEAVVHEHHHDRLREAARAECIVREEAERYLGIRTRAGAVGELSLRASCVA
jgi:glutamyl-tRNA reductase